jgi:hypothetical protein
MKSLIFFVILILNNKAFAESDYYYDCIQKAANSAQNKESLFLMQQVCSHKSIPKKCRFLKDDDGKIIKNESLKNDDAYSKNEKGKSFTYEWPSSELKREKSSRTICIESCQKESFFSKKLGDCSVG